MATLLCSELLSLARPSCVNGAMSKTTCAVDGRTISVSSVTTTRAVTTSPNSTAVGSNAARTTTGRAGAGARAPARGDKSDAATTAIAAATAADTVTTALVVTWGRVRVDVPRPIRERPGRSHVDHSSTPPPGAG